MKPDRTKNLSSHSGRRPKAGRALFYTRDSEGRSTTTPTEYIIWASDVCRQRGLSFTGTPELISGIIRNREAHNGDTFVDWDVPGNVPTRPGLDALIAEVRKDLTVSHVLIPRPDRLSRPNQPKEALELEDLLRRQLGVSLIFRDGDRKALRRGERAELGETILTTVQYHQAGEFRRELADKALSAHRSLAREGFSTGGRCKYGLQRWLVTQGGEAVRPLEDGEYVRRAGYHVAWLPRTDGTYENRCRIKQMLPTMRASQVARQLTREQVPSPDAGRTRADGGHRHEISGVWHATTIANIGRDTIDAGHVAYGRRSMGDQLRFGPERPRILEESDYRQDVSGDKPKVVQNPLETWVTGPAHFAPAMTERQQAELMTILDARATSQKGKPRSRTPEKNPLGTRIFDLECGWPMYRGPYKQSFRYVCGLYGQSHGATCNHNTVDGPTAVRFVLSCIQQRVFSAGRWDELRRRVEGLARAEVRSTGPADALEAKRSEARRLEKEGETIGRNMARAESDEQYRLITREFEASQGRLSASATNSSNWSGRTRSRAGPTYVREWKRRWPMDRTSSNCPRTWTISGGQRSSLTPSMQTYS
ncbi:MAG: Resolvase domain protein [Gammaproteobacteria bacterium]|nr:Resolvase domain protein [Gammaproteobacteria bacterium]